MAPVLLDQRSIIRASMAISLGLLVVFISGYYLGFQKAYTGKGIGLNKTMALALPRPAHADTAEYEPRIPTAPIPGADIDVDNPDGVVADAGSSQQEITQASKADTKVETVIKQTTTAMAESAVIDHSEDQDKKQLQLAMLDVASAVIESESETIHVEETQKTVNGNEQEHAGNQAGIADTASAEDARYTIQVGVFADSVNALRRKTELESHMLSAYVKEYTNKRDELRFNVRFGYFKDKTSAQAALSSFQQDMSGDGYVMKLRRN